MLSVIDLRKQLMGKTLDEYFSRYSIANELLL